MQGARATSGSFYHFFPAKEDLVLAVVDHAAGALENDVFAPAAEATGDPIEQIFEMLGVFRRQLLADDFTHSSPVGFLAAELSETHPQVRAKACEVFDLLTGRIESLLEQAAASLPAAADPRELAQLVACTLEGALLLARARRSVAPFDAAVSGLRRYLELLQTSATPGATAEEVPAPPRRVPQPKPHRTDWRMW